AIWEQLCAENGPLSRMRKSLRKTGSQARAGLRGRKLLQTVSATGHGGHFPEHCRPEWEDERKAVVSFHPANSDANQIAFLVQYAAAGHTWMPVSQSAHQTALHPLTDIAGAQDDALRVIVAKPEDGLREIVGIVDVDQQ